jgi:hypothetical protein
MLSRYDKQEHPDLIFSQRLLKVRPQALLEAVEILIARTDTVRTVLTRYPYTDPQDIGGFLDQVPAGAQPVR